ncbi:hypothetical protein LWI29_022450 [Acer saccharum]|uniref:Uncharacterized protein n=1 Tax=Acer saccharum TaxID=4024 RepID=A0AA39RM39_ACESA|nr:hypothetical protein LWI29_022450 [Acer saccharum]
MTSTPSITIDFSPMHQLSNKHPGMEEEAKAHRIRQWSLPVSDTTSPSHFQKSPTYVLAQLLGATLACLTLKVLFHDKENIHLITTQYSDATTDLEAIAWEFIMTFILMFTICGVATDHRACKDFAGVAIGVTLLFNVMISG